MSTYFATRRGGGGVFETSAQRVQFLKGVKGSPVGNDKNFATKVDARACARSDMAVHWPRERYEHLKARFSSWLPVDGLDECFRQLAAEKDETQVLIREHASTNEGLREEIVALNERLRVQQAKTSGRVLGVNEATHKDHRLVEEQYSEALCDLDDAAQRSHTLEAWLRASLDVLQGHTDQAPERLVADHLCHQGRADLGASDIVSELPEPVLLHKKGNMARFAVVACVFTLLFQVMAITALVMGFQLPNPGATPSMDLCVSGTSGCSLDMAVAPSSHDFTVLASLIASPFCGMMVAAFFI